jgi:hypothetical protein
MRTVPVLKVFIFSVVCGNGKRESEEVGAQAGRGPMLLVWEYPLPRLLWVPSHIFVPRKYYISIDKI